MPMNSIASLRRTETRARFSAAKAATVLAALMLVVVIMSFRPFQPSGAGMADDVAAAGGSLTDVVTSEHDILDGIAWSIA